MNDTSAEIEEMQHALMAKLGPERRIELACEMYLAARESILRSLPPGASQISKNRELVKRLYGAEVEELFYEQEDKQ